MIIKRIYENQNLLLLWLVSFLVRLCVQIMGMSYCLIYNLKALHQCHICTYTLRRAFHTWCVGMSVIQATKNFTCLVLNIHQLSPSDQQLQKIFQPWKKSGYFTFHKTITLRKVVLPISLSHFCIYHIQLLFTVWFIVKLGTARSDSHMRITDLQRSFHVFHLR
jgi:hypothetical protein